MGSTIAIIGFVIRSDLSEMLSLIHAMKTHPMVQGIKTYTTKATYELNEQGTKCKTLFKFSLHLPSE